MIKFVAPQRTDARDRPQTARYEVQQEVNNYAINLTLDFLTELTEAPTEEPKTKGPKAWVIAVAVVASLGIVGLGMAGIIWWKWHSRALGMGYTKQQDDIRM